MAMRLKAVRQAATAPVPPAPRTAWKDVLPGRDVQFEMKRQALLREAASAFNRKGFHGTSLDDIARKLHVTKAALYHYFPNKHALLAACFALAMDAAFKSLQRARQQGGTGQDVLMATVRGYLEAMINELSSCVILTEENALLPEDQAVLIRQRDEFELELRKLVREGIADGSIVACDPKLAVFCVLGAINWVPKWFSHEGAWHSTQLAAALTELLGRALASRPSPAATTNVGALPIGGMPAPSLTLPSPAARRVARKPLARPQRWPKAKGRHAD